MPSWVAKHSAMTAYNIRKSNIPDSFVSHKLFQQIIECLSPGFYVSSILLSHFVVCFTTQGNMSWYSRGACPGLYTWEDDANASKILINCCQSDKNDAVLNCACPVEVPVSLPAKILCCKACSFRVNWVKMVIVAPF